MQVSTLPSEDQRAAVLYSCSSGEREANFQPEDAPGGAAVAESSDDFHDGQLTLSGQELGANAEALPGQQALSIRKKGKEKKFVCFSCNVGFTKPAYLRQHERSHTGERPFACTHEYCNKSFLRNDHLKRHLLSHEEQVRLKCDFPGCNVDCGNPFNLLRHKLRHADPPPPRKRPRLDPEDLVCKEAGCGRSFKYPSLLASHQLSAHRRPEFVCGVAGCGGLFSSMKALRVHGHTAHGSEGLQCGLCGQQFWSQRSARDHGATCQQPGASVVVPAPAEPAPLLACTIEGCTKRYARRGSLRHHMRAFHLMERPYVCAHEGCGSTFTLKQSRDRHHELHAIRHNNGEAVGVNAEGEVVRQKNVGGRKKQPRLGVEELIQDLDTISSGDGSEGAEREMAEEAERAQEMAILELVS